MIMTLKLLRHRLKLAYPASMLSEKASTMEKMAEYWSCLTTKINHVKCI